MLVECGPCWHRAAKAPGKKSATAQQIWGKIGKIMMKITAIFTGSYCNVNTKWTMLHVL